MMKKHVLLRELRRLCEAENKVFTAKNAAAVIGKLVHEDDSGREGTQVRSFVKIGRKRRIGLVNGWPAFEDGVRVTPDKAEKIAAELVELGHKLEQPAGRNGAGDLYPRHRPPPGQDDPPEY